jgi:hypothetical protein
MIRKTNEFELINLFLLTHLSMFGSKLFLTLKIMDFENVTLVRSVDIYAIKA